MPPLDPQAVMEKLGQTTLKVDTFFLRRTGFVANQTVLKLGEYTLHCVPATLGAEGARFLAVLTPSEIDLFSKFKAGTHTLLLTFDNPESKDIMRFPLKVGLTELNPVPDRKNVCFIQLKFKSLPAPFVLFLGAYFDELEARQKAWDKLAEDELPFDAAAAKRLGADPGFELSSGAQKWPVELVSFHTKQLTLKAAPGAAMPSCRLRLGFRGRPLVLEGALDNAGHFQPEFSTEWLDLVEDSVFQLKLRPNPEASKGAG